MPQTVICPQCGKRYQVKDELAGRTVKCACGGRFPVPGAPPSSPQPLVEPLTAPLAPTAPSMADAGGRYRPSGRVLWVRFALVAAGTLGGAGVVALILAAMRRADLYLPGLTGLIVGVLAAIGTGVAVTWGHCRSRAWGTALGTALGLIGLLGQFQFELALDLGVAHLVRVDRLPGRVLDHIRNDAIVPQRRNPRQPVTPAPVANAIILLVEFIVAPLFGAFAGWTLAGRVYDEPRGRWAQRRWVMVAQGQAKELKRAAESGTLAAALARVPPADEAHGKKVTVLILDTLSPSAESPSPALYLTAGEITLTVPESWIEKIIYFMPATFRQRRLNEPEAAALRRWFSV